VKLKDKQRYTARKIFQLVQDEALVDGRAVANGSRLRRGDERFKFSPLFAGKALVVLHEWVQ
jgi:hypothetical protein